MTISDRTNKLIEQRIAEMSDTDFAALVSRTRAPALDPKKQQAADMAAAMIRGTAPATESPTATPARSDNPGADFMALVEKLRNRDNHGNPTATTAPQAQAADIKDRAANMLRDLTQNR